MDAGATSLVLVVGWCQAAGCSQLVPPRTVPSAQAVQPKLSRPEGCRL